MKRLLLTGLMILSAHSLTSGELMADVANAVSDVPAPPAAIVSTAPSIQTAISVTPAPTEPPKETDVSGDNEESENDEGARIPLKKKGDASDLEDKVAELTDAETTPAPGSVPLDGIPLSKYDPEWARFKEIDEPAVRFLKAALDEEGNGGEKYLDWVLGENRDKDNPPEVWGAAFLSWAAETGYSFVSSGVMPKTNDPNAFYMYMTNVSWCRSYAFRTAYPFQKVTAIYIGDLVYPCDPSGKCLDVGAVVEITDTYVSVIYGSGESVHIRNYTAADFSDPSSPEWNAKLQHIEYKANSRICLEFLLNDCQFNYASALGIMANLSMESAFSPVWSGDNGTSFGLCQWHGERWLRLEAFCFENGLDMTHLSTQLQFMKAELQNQGVGVYNKLKYEIPDTQEGAGTAARIFCVEYENPQDVEERAEERAKSAMYAFWPYYAPVG